MTTWLITAGAPRSVPIHCGSLNPLDHRVFRLPSNAAFGGVAPLCVEEAVAGWPYDSRMGAALAVTALAHQISGDDRQHRAGHGRGPGSSTGAAHRRCAPVRLGSLMCSPSGTEAVRPGPDRLGEFASLSVGFRQ